MAQGKKPNGANEKTKEPAKTETTKSKDPPKNNSATDASKKTPVADPGAGKKTPSDTSVPVSNEKKDTPVTVGRDVKRDVLPTNTKTKEPKLSKTELKLRELAEQVEDLKNKVTSSKYRLQLLKEAMTDQKETLGGAKIIIKHRNEMGGVYRLVRLRYFLDGNPIKTYSDVIKADKVALSKKDIPVVSDHVTPGNKRVRVFISYLGNGYGLFRYVKEWKWEVKNSYSFSVEPGKLYVLTVIGKEKGNMTTPLDERPTIKFKLEVRPLVSSKKSTGKSGKSKSSK